MYGRTIRWIWALWTVFAALTALLMASVHYWFAAAVWAGNAIACVWFSRKLWRLRARKLKDGTTILARKHAMIVWDAGQPRFRGIGMYQTYTSYDRSICVHINNDSMSRYRRHIQRPVGVSLRKFMHHDAPAEWCSCGFYALPVDRNQHLRPSISHVALDVELGGKIVVHTDGYRAEWQSVLKVWVYHRCHSCSDPPTHVMYARSLGATMTSCARHLHNSMIDGEPIHAYTLDELMYLLGAPVAAAAPPPLSPTGEQLW